MKKKIIENTGIIISTSDYQDTSVIAQILTKNGMISCIIKGVRKANSGNLKISSILTLIEFTHTDTLSLKTLCTSNVLDNYTNLKENLNKYNNALIVLEKVKAFASHVKDFSVFYSFTLSILDLLKKEVDEIVVISIFEIKLLYLLGIEPNLKYCLKCHQEPDDFHLVINDGGILCKQCSINNMYLVDTSISKYFKLIYLTKMNNIDLVFNPLFIGYINKIQDVVDIYYESHLDFHSKTKELIKKIGR